MDRIRAYCTKAAGFFKTHKLARIACIVLLVLAALFFFLHPQGTRTFLVLGMDNYGSLDETGRSDVTLLVQVDFSRSKISAVTFARDMFIENENDYLTKINTVVRSQAEEGLCSLLEKNFGVTVDDWFRVNFTSVIELVDAIGGAEVELTKAEVSYLNKNVGYYPDYPLSEGLCRLNGAQALAYARCRKLDNDLGRGERQGKLLNAMVAQTRHLTAARIANVFNSLKHAWRSSMPVGEQVKLVFQALWLRGAQVEHIAMPFEGYWHYGSSGSVSGVVANLEENRALLLEALGRPASAD